ncbi:hypothetical protein [Streptomyces caatingaensis]|uniref:Lipoprotein n=1 Tax=Streptomyces caatingaensis TaxID=1678637 RepID=A0A0K9XEF3_9ACTN|nr:hypothetical protein [Streptomyces caatingaensis]KNB51481.1 hypothetical protein AC230_13895 [Streptomyces caatingaensis]
MSTTPRWIALTAASAALFAATTSGCSSGSDDAKPESRAAASNAPSPSATSPSAGGGGPVPVGPGPQPAYTVQKQPAAGTCTYRYTKDKQPLPDPKCTPGATNPKVTQATLKTTICRSGYTKGIRPPVSITNREKTANAESYGYKKSLRDAEYDHLISLQLGGDPNDPRNLWVEPPSPGHRDGAGPNNPKDVVETKLKNAVCSGKAELTAVQRAIAHDWTTALSAVGVPDDAKSGTRRQEAADADGD